MYAVTCLEIPRHISQVLEDTGESSPFCPQDSIHQPENEKKSENEKSENEKSENEKSENEKIS